MSEQIDTSNEFAICDFQAELRSASPALLHHMRDVLLACQDESIVHALVGAAVDEIDAALDSVSTGLH